MSDDAVLLVITLKDESVHLIKAGSLQKYLDVMAVSPHMPINMNRAVSRYKIDDVEVANELLQHIYTKSQVVQPDLLTKYVSVRRDGRLKEVTKKVIDRWEEHFMARLTK